MWGWRTSQAFLSFGETYLRLSKKKKTIYNIYFVLQNAEGSRKTNSYPMGRSGSRLSAGNFLVRKFSCKIPLIHRDYVVFQLIFGYLISYCPCQFVHPGSCLCNLLGCINDIRCVLQGALPSVKHKTITHNLNKSQKATVSVTLLSALLWNNNTNVFLIYYHFAF